MGQVQAQAAQVNGAAQQAVDSRWTRGLARLGLAARGLTYLLLAVLAVQIARGDGHGKEADQKGAFQTLAQNAAGEVVLWLVVVGFLAYGLWQAGEAVWARHAEAGGDSPIARGRAAAVAAGYLLMALLAARIALGSGGGQSGASESARLMRHGWGRILVGAVGVGVAAVGLGMAVEGLRLAFAAHLNPAQLSGRARQVVVRLGQVGTIARGAVVLVAGVLLVVAAVTFQPDKANGLDSALKTLAGRAYGTWLLAAVAAGLVCFGVYSLVETRYRRL